MQKTDHAVCLGSGILLGNTPPGLLCHPAPWPQTLSVSLLRTSTGGKPDVSSPTWTGGLQTWFMQIRGWQPSKGWPGKGETKGKPSPLLPKDPAWKLASSTSTAKKVCEGSSEMPNEPYWPTWAIPSKKEWEILF